MSIFALGDLHLGTNVDKPMDIFDDIWENHSLKIQKNWENIIKDEDLVLIPGDVSWAMSLEEAYEDLEFISKLKGKKIICKGNHDYWWSSINKMNSMFYNIKFLQNNFYTYNDIAICGSRGWICPNGFNFTSHDEKIYNREINRIKFSIESAIKSGYKDIIVIMHYPPTNETLQNSEFIKLFYKYNVIKVVFGHLHGKENFKNCLKDIRDSIEYKLVSCDFLNFTPIKIL